MARLRKTRGRRGELLGEIYSARRSETENFPPHVVLEKEGKRLEASITELWFHDGVPVFKFAGLDSISDAEVWEGADVLVPAEHKLALEDGEYRYGDLIGSRVLAAGKPVGVVEDIHEYGGPVTLVIKTASGREAMIPFVRAFCRRIDVAAKVIEADLPEGLLDL